MKIVTMFLPEETTLLDIHRAAALLRCYVKPSLDGRLEIRPITAQTPHRNVVKFPRKTKTDNTPPSAA